MTAQAFDKELKQTLKHVRDAAWLGEHSTLATPYFLGGALAGPSSRPDPATRGQALQRALAAAADDLWGDGPPAARRQVEAEMAAILQAPGSARYHFLLLDLRYFQRHFKPRRLSQIWEEFLGLSRAQFYRDLDEAVTRLGEALLARVRPTFRLERPRADRELVGRDALVREALTALAAGESVALSGAGGIGKTSTGMAIAAAWPGEAAFWYTVRPTLNDQPASLLFCLAHYLRGLGATALWSQLMAQAGIEEDLRLALGLLAEDLASLPAPPLLCFDELDRLRPPEGDRPLRDHAQILELLDGLRDLAPLLLVGQRAVLDTDRHVALTGLEPRELAALLRQNDVTAADAAVRRLHEATAGNPRLALLAAALAHQGDALDAIAGRLATVPALLPLFDRWWGRVGPREQRVLAALAVFRGPAPADAWPAQREALAGLLERGLVQADGAGGVTLWPALRELIYRELPAERREALHREAAATRAARGEFTPAAYHFWRAGRPDQAVQLWFPRRRSEIGRGQGAAALAVFAEISAGRLRPRERRALGVIRAELRRLEGEARAGLQALEAVDWTLPSELALSARTLRGEFLEALGQPDAGMATYDEAVSAATRLLNQTVWLRARRARLRVRQRQMDEAWQEALLAQYEAENLQGVVLAEQGRYAEALLAYRRALAVAESLGHDAGLAQTHRDLTTLLSRQAKLAEAVEHAEQAIAYYDRVGDRLNRETVRSLLASTYIQTRRFAEAVAAAEQALPFFQRIGHTHGIAATAANLAEGCYELGDLERARQFAGLVLTQEEPFTQPYGLFTLGLVDRAEGALEKALASLRLASQIAAQNEDVYMWAYAERALGETSREAGDGDAAMSALETSLALFVELGMEAEAEATRRLLAS